MYKELAAQTRELFHAFKDAGFTENQALELTKSQFALAYVNNLAVEVERPYSKRQRTEMLRRYVEKQKKQEETDNE